MKISFRSLCFAGLLALGIACSTEPPGPSADDGTEVNGRAWYEEGYQAQLNYLGRKGDQRFDCGLRLDLPGCEQGDRLAYARLRFTSQGSRITDRARIRIEGLLEEQPAAFSADRKPSDRTTRTQARVLWTIEEEWLAGSRSVPCTYTSPDLSPILNEILALPGWGSPNQENQGQEKKVALVLTDESAPGSENYVTFNDSSREETGFKCPVTLECFPALYDTFVGKELLCRVTDRSVTVNLYGLLAMDTFVEYGTSPGSYPQRTREFLNQPATTAINLVLENLSPDTAYHYRLAYRMAGQGEYLRGEERSFHTQRQKGETFCFAIQSDEHIQNAHRLPRRENKKTLYRITHDNIALGKPDFLLSLGDFANTEFNTGRDANRLQEALERYLMQRNYIDRITHSIPFFLGIGNHEGENGWSVTPEKQALMRHSIIARKTLIPNPRSGPFYRVNPEIYPTGQGPRENYFAWEWGDALFVVLDPFSYSDPENGPMGWGWTLGKQQYDWLYETLHTTTATWKLVFIHHLTSSVTETDQAGVVSPYGRGGIEIAKYKVDGRASLEWGGENARGEMIFAKKRPGWSHGPVHDLLVAEGVHILFHGHDHLFAKQDLDGIVYQECPQPINAKHMGYPKEGGYKFGKLLPNAGHLRVHVAPESVKVQYVRSFLPKDPGNGRVEFEYVIK